MIEELLDPRRTVVFAGDSVTDCGRREDRRGLGDGYVRDLFDSLGPQRPRIVNVGISGNRAADLEARWQTDVLARQPDVVSVLIGINDTWRRYDKNDPTSTESFERSYRALLEPVRAKLILVEPFLLAVKDDQDAWREDLDPKIEVVRRLASSTALCWCLPMSSSTGRQQLSGRPRSPMTASTRRPPDTACSPISGAVPSPEIPAASPADLVASIK